LGGARCCLLKRLGQLSIGTILLPQFLQVPGLIPILSKAIFCQGLGSSFFFSVTFKLFLIVLGDFLFEALDKNP
jgi:hypothetical protein